MLSVTHVSGSLMRTECDLRCLRRGVGMYEGQREKKRDKKINEGNLEISKGNYVG